MLIYVMGRGYSGSTILDILLGNCSDIESVGEFAAAMGRIERQRCTCGEMVCDCQFWSSVRGDAENHQLEWLRFSRETNQSARLRHLWTYFCSNRQSPRLVQLAQETELVARAIAKASGKAHMLESSKSPVRAYFLLKFLPETRVIHLVRDPRSVMRSTYWRFQNGKPLRFRDRAYRPHGLAPFFLAFAALGWLVGNLLAELLVRRYGSRVVEVHYEDLRDHPIEVLAHAAEKCGFSLDGLDRRMTQGERLEVGHNIGGNKIRLMKDLKFDPQAAERDRPALPSWVSAMTTCICWPLMLRYHYLPKPTPHPPALPAL